jgi:hypothetical protein
MVTESATPVSKKTRKFLHVHVTGIFFSRRKGEYRTVFTIHIEYRPLVLGTSETRAEHEAMPSHNNGLWELRHSKQFCIQLFVYLHVTLFYLSSSCL